MVLLSGLGPAFIDDFCFIVLRCLQAGGGGGTTSRERSPSNSKTDLGLQPCPDEVRSSRRIPILCKIPTTILSKSAYL